MQWQGQSICNVTDTHCEGVELVNHLVRCTFFFYICLSNVMVVTFEFFGNEILSEFRKFSIILAYSVNVFN